MIHTTTTMMVPLQTGVPTLALLGGLAVVAIILSFVAGRKLIGDDEDVEGEQTDLDSVEDDSVVDVEGSVEDDGESGVGTTTDTVGAGQMVEMETVSEDEVDVSQEVTYSDDFEEQKVVDDIDEVHKAALAPPNVQTDQQNHEYLRTGKNSFQRSYFVTGWPESMGDGQLQKLFAQSGLEVDVSLYIDPIPTEEALSQLGEEVQELEADVQLLQEDGNTVEARDKQRELSDYRGMRDTIRDTPAELFDVGFYLTVVAETEEMLERRSDELEDTLTGKSFNPTLAKKDQVATHRSVTPIWDDDVELQQSMMSAAIGGMFPFSSATLIKDQGIPVGEHAENGSPIIYDRFDHDRGYNWLTIGNIGAGKSFSTKLHLLRRRMYDPNTVIVMLDPLQGFAGITSALDGKHVTVGGDTGLNPLEIKRVPQHILDNNDELNPGRAKLKDLESFFSSFYDLQDQTLGKKWNVLQKALRKAYQNRGIDLDDPSTHGRENPTIQDDLIPILADMVANQEEHSILNKIPGVDESDVDELMESAQSVTEKERERASELLLSMQAFVEGNALANLGRQSNFDFGDEEVIWLDLQQQEGRGSLGLMMNLLFSAVYERAKTSDQNMVFAIDEARYIMRDKSALQFLEQAVRHSRHYDLSIQFITQTIDEFFQHEEAEAIADQCDHKMFFHTEGLDGESADKVGMNDMQAQFARNATPGDEETGYSECVFGVADEGWYPVHIRAMDEEAAIVDLDPTTDVEDVLPGLADEEQLPARVKALRQELLSKQVMENTDDADPVIPEKEVSAGDGDGVRTVADTDAMTANNTIGDVLSEQLADGGIEQLVEDDETIDESPSRPDTNGGIDASAQSTDSGGDDDDGGQRDPRKQVNTSGGVDAAAMYIDEDNDTDETGDGDSTGDQSQSSETVDGEESESDDGDEEADE